MSGGPADAAARARVAAFAELAGAVARELADPMSIVLGRIELAIELNDQERERHLRVAMDHARRLSATIGNLGGLGRANAEGRAFVADGAYRAVALVGPRIRLVEVRIAVAPARDELPFDVSLLARALAEGLGFVIDAVGVAPRVDLVAARAGGWTTIEARAGAVDGDLPPVSPPGPVGPALAVAYGGVCTAGARAGAAPAASVRWQWPVPLAGNDATR